MIALLLLAAAQETAPVFVEAVAEPPAPLREQPVRVTLRVGVRRDFLEQSMLQPFRAPLEFPLQVEAGWNLEGWAARAAPPADPASPRLVLDGEIVRADRARDALRDGRAWRIVEFEREFLPLAAGTLALAAPRARWAWSEQTATDPFGGSVAGARRDGLAAGAPLALEVAEWPLAGRAEHFGAAVGSFRLAVALAEEPALGAGLHRIRIEITGEGNWERLEPPPLDRLPGLHLLGRLVERAPGRVVVTADFERSPDAPAAFPALRWSHLLPGAPARTVTLASEPVPWGSATPAPVEAPPAAAPSTAPDAARGTAEPLLWIALGGLAVALGCLIGARRRASRAPRLRSGTAAEEPAARLTAELAAVLGCAPARLHAPDLEARLRARGAPPDFAREATRLFELLHAQRYGGPRVEDAVAAMQRLLAAWPPALRPRA